MAVLVSQFGKLVILEAMRTGPHSCILLNSFSMNSHQTLVNSVTPIFLVYVVLMIMGSWIIPLITSYIPHDPRGETESFQTRLFRGKVVSIIALEHTYHLEHHLFPSVPHHNWPQLARRLDPFFQEAGLKPIRLWF